MFDVKDFCCHWFSSSFEYILCQEKKPLMCDILYENLFRGERTET